MRAALVLGAMLLVLVSRGQVVAEEPPSQRAAADALIEAHGASAGEERAAAALEGQDPWLVCDELIGRGRVDVARFAAEAVALEPERDALRIYFARRLKHPAQEGERAALASASAASDLSRMLNELTPLVERASGDQNLPTILDARLLRQVAGAAAGGPDAALALVYLERALARARLLGWARQEMHLSTQLARRQAEQGDLGAAARTLRSTQPLWSAYRSLPVTIACMEEARVTLDAMGEVREARSVAEEMGAAAASEGRTGDAAMALSNQGLFAEARGQLLEALDLHERALAFAGLPGDVVREIHGRIAVVREKSGAVSEALAAYQTLLGQHKHLQPPDPLGEGLVRGNMARALTLLGRYEDALRELDATGELIASEQPIEARYGVPIHRAWVASLWGRDLDTRRAALRVLLDEPESKASPATRVMLLEALARCALRSRDASGAIAALEEAAKLCEDHGLEDSDTADVVGTLGTAYALVEEHAKAVAHFNRYVQLLAGRIDGMERGAETTYQGIILREVIASAVATGLSTRDYAALWRYLEAARGLRLLAGLGGRGALSARQVDPTLLAALHRAQLEEVDAWRTLGGLREAGKPRKGSKEWESAGAQLSRAEEARRAAASAVARDAARHLVADLGEAPGLLPLADAVRALGPDEALVSLSMEGPDGSVLALVVRPDGVKAKTLGVRADLDALQRSMRRSAADAQRVALLPSERAKHAKALASAIEREGALLRAALDLPPEVRWVGLIPEGSLCYLPYAAMLPDLDVTLLPSGTLYASLLKQQRRLGRVSLALGDPDYKGTSLSGARAATGLVALRGGLGSLRPLPKSRSEAEYAAQSGGIALLDKSATALRLREVLAAHPTRRWRSIHFACHGLIDPSRPAFSGLALTGGVVTAQELFGMPLAADVVVLSACSTGTDPYAIGEGISGLVRACLSGGAPRVLVSLWPVPDEVTEHLMRVFYDTLQDPNVSIGDALRAAQLEVRKARGDSVGPQDWAAWTLWGVR